jgi:Fe-Mn family superoxide dismutase
MNASVHSAPSSDVLDEINHSFSSLDTLRESFLTTAQAMFGPGFVWLVQVNEVSAGSVRNSFRILPTYLAGSPVSGAHYRRQSLDLNTENPDSYTSKGLNPVGAFGSAAQTVKKDKKALGGVDVIPLLCVNTWEHVWLHDYGIKGKRDYLERWWEAIHWNKVAEHATIAPKQRQNQFTYTSSI